MNVGTTQSQSLITSISFSTTITRTQEVVPQSGAAASGDLLDLNRQIDGGYASTVLQHALEERLEAAFEAAGLDAASVKGLKASGLDTSSEATAGRLVDFATSFYEQYETDNQGEQARLEGFVALIRGAIEEGFGEARTILSGIGEIAAQVQAGIDETFEQTMKGVDDFAGEQLELLARAAGEEAPEAGVL